MANHAIDLSEPEIVDEMTVTFKVKLRNVERKADTVTPAVVSDLIEAIEETCAEMIGEGFDEKTDLDTEVDFC